MQGAISAVVHSFDEASSKAKGGPTRGRLGMSCSGIQEMRYSCLMPVLMREASLLPLQPLQDQADSVLALRHSSQLVTGQSVWSSRRPVVVCSRRAVPSRRDMTFCHQQFAWAALNVKRTDFAGLWFCFETEGDMDALLVSLEVSWAKRCLDWPCVCFLVPARLSS